MYSNHPRNQVVQSKWWQFSCGWLGRSSYAKSACNFRNVLDGQTDKRTDGQKDRRRDGWTDGWIDQPTNPARCRVASLRLKNKVIRPKSRASALSGRQTWSFKKTFELATKSLRNNFETNQWTDRQMDRRMDWWMDGGQINQKVAYRSVRMTSAKEQFLN